MPLLDYFLANFHSFSKRNMRAEVEKLSQITYELRQELRWSAEKMVEKELALSKEKLKTADLELQLNREKQSKLKTSQTAESIAAALAREIAETKKVRSQLVNALSKIKGMENEIEAELEAEAQTVTTVEPDVVTILKQGLKTPEIEKPAEMNDKIKTTAEPLIAEYPAEVDGKLAAKADESRAEVVTKATKTTVAPKRIIAQPSAKGVRGKAAAKKSNEVKLVENASTTVATPVKAVAKEANAKAAKESSSTSSQQNWSSLSKSTLQRKKLDDLTGYLEAKVCVTAFHSSFTLRRHSLTVIFSTLGSACHW